MVYIVDPINNTLIDDEKPFTRIANNLGKNKKVEPVQLTFDFNKPKVQEPRPVVPEKPLEVIIKEASDRRLKQEQEAYQEN